MATKISVTYKGSNKNSNSNIDISELPNIGDHINLDGILFLITGKTFHSANDVFTGVEFDLTPA